MIIVQVFRGWFFFLVRRAIATASAISNRRFRMAPPDVRHGPIAAMAALPTAISAARHPPFGDAIPSFEKKAPPHLGRTRVECL
jgi:hypothetical protein